MSDVTQFLGPKVLRTTVQWFDILLPEAPALIQ